MANHKQAKKRHKQSLRRRARNQHNMSMMRTHIKRARIAIEARTDDAGEALRTAISAIGHVAQKGAIHANTASRTIGRLSKAFHDSQK